MNLEEMRSLTDADLAQEIETLREEWRNLRFQDALVRLATFNQFSEVRKNIARLKTIQRERQLAGGQGDAAGVAAGRTKGTAKRGTRRASRR